MVGLPLGLQSSSPSDSNFYFTGFKDGGVLHHNYRKNPFGTMLKDICGV